MYFLLIVIYIMVAEIAIIIICFIIIIYIKVRAIPKSIVNAPDDLSNVRGIAISSGGIYGYMVPAILLNLQKRGLRSEALTHFVGTSVGAITCAMLAMHMNPSEIKDVMFRFNTKTLNASSGSYGSCFPGIDMISSDAISEFLGSVIGDITFQELYNTYGSTLIVVTSELSIFSKPFYISRFNYPNMRVCDAVQISSAIPAIMAPVRLDGRWLADGAATDPYPFKKLKQYLPVQSCIGILFDYYNTQITANCFTINSDSIYAAAQSRAHPWNTLSTRDRMRTIRVACNDCESMNILDLTDADKERIYQHGLLH